jgi:hypothetical protein
MSIENLLKPRFEVIRDYPNNPEKIGSILYSENLEQFPHLFRKMEWWEKRKKNEMPLFVKSNFVEYKVRKIISWNKKIQGILDEKNGAGKNIVADVKIKQYGYLPATEEEYLAFISLNQVICI